MAEQMAELNKSEYRIITDSERFIGKIVVNGTEKDLFEKIYEASGSYSGATTVDIGFSSGYEIYDYSILGLTSTSEYLVPYVNKQYDEYAGAFFGNDRKLYLRITSVSFTRIRVRVQYTKS